MLGQVNKFRLGPGYSSTRRVVSEDSDMVETSRLKCFSFKSKQINCSKQDLNCQKIIGCNLQNDIKSMLYYMGP